MRTYNEALSVAMHVAIQMFVLGNGRLRRSPTSNLLC
jgi:hypothetical protein